MAAKNKNSKQQDRLPFLKSRAGKYGVIFFISAWMFVLGVLVGRGTAPVKFDIDQLSKELAELRQSDIKEQMERLKIDAEDIKPKTALEFYEELKKTPQQVKRKIVATPKTPESPPSEPPPARKPPSDTTSSESRPPEKTQPPPEKRSGSASASGETSGAKTLTIQAASLKEMKAADELVARLKKKGYPAYKTIGVVPDRGIWFRVRIGEFGSPAEAVGTLNRLKGDGFDPILVQK